MQKVEGERSSGGWDLTYLCKEAVDRVEGFEYAAEPRDVGSLNRGLRVKGTKSKKGRG